MGDNQRNGFHRQSGGRGGRGRGVGHGRMRMDEVGSNKRKRAEQHEDPYLGLLSSILRLGDRLPGEERPVEREIKELANGTGRAIASMPDQVIQTVLDCAVEVGAKVHMYAALVGLWHADEETIVTELLEQGCQKLNAALGVGDKYQIRLLLRFFATLSTTNVVSMQSVFSMLHTIVQAAIECIQGGYQAEASRRLQPYTDSLVYSATIALPWMAPELQQLETAPEGLTALEGSIEQYLGLRQQDTQLALNAFPVTSQEEGSSASLTGNGVAEFLPELWEAMKELKANQWQLTSIPSYSHSPEFEAHLAAGQPLKLHELTVPCQPPGVAPGLPLPQAAAAVLQAYPPRGGLKLQLAVQQVAVIEATSAIDRIVVQEYVIDTMHYFDGDNNELARRLGIALPVPDMDSKVLAALVDETIFSQLLRLPHSELGVLAYAKVTTNLCKLKKEFANPMGGCVKALKDSMRDTDPEVALRVADWLALHINNHDFIWPWPRWENVLELPLYDPVRHFVAFALERTMRVSYRSFHVKEERVPEHMFKLLGPEPSPKPVFEAAQQPAPGAAESATNGVTEAAPAAAEAAQPNGTAEAAEAADAAPMEAAEQPEAQSEAVPQLALDLLQQVKQIQAPKSGDYRHQLQAPTALHERLSAWLSENNVEEGLGGPLELLRWLSRCLLTIGGRSIGHLYSYLDRHDPIMAGLVQTTGDEGEDALMQEATSIWATSVQRSSIIVDHLMGKRWLSGPAVLRWLFSPAAQGMQSADNAMECLKCMDILHNTVARILARSQDDQEELQHVDVELQRQETALKELQASAPPAADGDAVAPPANPALQAAQEAVQRLQSHCAGAQLNVEESIGIQNEVLLQVCKGYLALLTQQAPTSTADVPAAGAADASTDDVAMQEADAPTNSTASFEAWQKRTLAAFRAFLRSHSMVMAPLATQIQELMNSEVPDIVKQVARPTSVFVD